MKSGADYGERSLRSDTKEQCDGILYRVNLGGTASDSHC